MKPIYGNEVGKSSRQPPDPRSWTDYLLTTCLHEPAQNNLFMLAHVDLQPKAKHPTSLNHQITQPPQTCYKIIPDRLSQSIIKCKVPYSTLPENNIAPKNGWLEYYFPIGEAYYGLFSGANCQFQGG